MEKNMLKAADVARILGIHQSLLIRYRKAGKGPPHETFENSAPRYPADQLRVWLTEEAARRRAKAKAEADAWERWAFEAFNQIVKNLQPERTE